MVHKDNDVIGTNDAIGTSNAISTGDAAGKSESAFSVADRHAGSTMTSPVQDKVVDFLAWRRAHPLPTIGKASVEVEAVILPLFQERPQSLPAFDYSGDVAARLRPSPQLPSSSPRAAAPQLRAGQPARAVRSSAITDNAAAHKWDPRNWPSGLSWLVKNMADGMVDMNNLQTMLSDMQQELDALESSMDRLRGDAGVTDLEPTDLELVEPHELTGPRRACDMTGRPVEAPTTETPTTEMPTTETPLIETTSIEMTKGD